MLAQDAMAYLFGPTEGLTASQRLGSMYGDVPILYLHAAHTMLLTNPMYFSVKAAGIFVCNPPELVAQIKEEEKALSDFTMINNFIAAGK